LPLAIVRVRSTNVVRIFVQFMFDLASFSFDWAVLLMDEQLTFDCLVFRREFSS